ncbi:MAG: hypothetical protein MJE68_32685 [Proteobacteria bacterium]|nr:hypothetical protein [Pseudomonadota bacterium]
MATKSANRVYVHPVSRGAAVKSLKMPKHDDKNLTITDDDEKPEFIPFDDAMLAEWMKDPKFVREYEALGPKYERLERRIRARKARRARRKALVKRVRSFWATLIQGLTQPLRG